MAKIQFIRIALAATLLVGCSDPDATIAQGNTRPTPTQTTATAPATVTAQAASNDSGESLTIQGAQLVLASATQTQVLHTASADIETLAGDDDWLIWRVDDDPRLWLGHFKPGQLRATALPALSHDAEVLCLGRQNADLFDVFIHDGEGYFHHYWLNPAAGKLQAVRRLATNPEISHCQLDGRQLRFSDPHIGVLGLDRNPESDPIQTLLTSADDTAFAQQPTLNRYQPGTRVEQPRDDFAVVAARAETTPVESSNDAADDPAILVGANTTWIAGTDKQRGLAIYDLAGQRLHFNARGRLNNVDKLSLGDERFLLAATNRTTKTIDLFIADLAANSLVFHSVVALDMDDPYGLCMDSSAQGVRIFVGDSEGALEHWQLAADLRTGTRIQRFQFESQTEGCTLDSTANQLYVGEEDLGIWRIDLDAGKKTLIEATSKGNLVADVEGLSLYNGEQTLLIASSQGDDSYALFTLKPWQFVGKFRIGANSAMGIDGASETDGLDVASAAIPGYPAGLLVVQDGRNRAPDANQNFKLVDWRAVQALIDHWQEE